MDLGVERLRYLVEFATDRAQRDLRQLGDTAEREVGTRTGGVFTRMKGTATQSLGAVKQYAGQAALALGGALVVGGLKAVDMFTDAALAAGKFADATGLSKEASSRWIEVAGDLGVSTETLQGGFLRLNKALGSGSPVAEKYGISLQRTADGATDVNATMLLAIERIGRIKDPTERAAAAQQLFGRSYAEMAEIVLGDADKIRAALDDVADAKVFDQEEVNKARRQREVMDQLKDTFEELALTAGEGLLPALEFVATSLQSLGSIAGRLHIVDILEDFARLDDVALDLGRNIRSLWDGGEAKRNAEIVRQFDEANEAAKGFDQSLLAGIETYDQAREVAQRYVDTLDGNFDRVHAVNQITVDWSKSQQEATEAVEDTTAAVAEQARENSFLQGIFRTNMRLLDYLTGSWERLRGEISKRDAYRGLKDQFDQIGDAFGRVVDAQGEFGAGSQEAEKAARDLDGAVDDLRLRVLDYGESVRGVPKAWTTNVLALIDQGKLAEAEKYLDWLARPRDVPLVPKVRGSGGGNPYFAQGTNYAPGGLAVVGEEGPELVELPRGSKVHTAAETRAMASRVASGPVPAQAGTSVYVTVNAGIGTDGAQVGRQIAEILSAYVRNGGRLQLGRAG